MDSKLQIALYNQKRIKRSNQLREISLAFLTSLIYSRFPQETKQKIEENSDFFKIGLGLILYFNPPSYEDKRFLESYFHNVSFFNEILA